MFIGLNCVLIERIYSPKTKNRFPLIQNELKPIE